MHDIATFRLRIRSHTRLALLLALPVALTVCSTVPSQAPAPEDETAPDRRSAKTVGPNVPQAETEIPSEFTFDRGPLALFVREFNSWCGRNLVLINGLELIQVGPYEFQNQPPDSVLDRVAEDAALKIHHAASYDLLLTEGYESLSRLDMKNAIDPELASRKADVRFGADTPLYAAFALVGQALDTTLIGDNIVAGATSGEVQLTGVTFADALTALLQSARVAEGNVRVQAEENLTFLYAPGNPLRTDLLLNADEIDPAARAILDRRISLTLPYPPDSPEHLRGDVGAVRLQACLDSASEQLGVRLMTDARAADLPVNPAVMHDVTMRTALRLLIHQWPVSDYGYVFVPEGIRIEHAPLSEQAEAP